MSFLGVDIGGTAVKLAMVDRQGNIRAQGEHPVNHDGYKTPILTTATQRARDFCDARGFTPEGVGVSATGQIDVRRGVVAGTCGNLPGWEGAPIRQAFAEAFSVPVAVMNDVNCALMGEAWRGGARGCRDAVMITLGTGVGCAMLVDGRIVNGRSGFAGEGGHFPTHAGGRPCTCGNAGCYEQYASVTALLRMVKKAMGPGAPANGREVFARLAAGDEAVAAAVDRWTQEIAVGLVGLVHLCNPEVVLIGGGVSAQEALIESVRGRVLSRVMPRYRDGLRVNAATLGNSAGVLGAVRFWQEVFGADTPVNA